MDFCVVLGVLEFCVAYVYVCICFRICFAALILFASILRFASFWNWPGYLDRPGLFVFLMLE